MAILVVRNHHFLFKMVEKFLGSTFKMIWGSKKWTYILTFFLRYMGWEVNNFARHLRGVGIHQFTKGQINSGLWMILFFKYGSNQKVFILQHCCIAYFVFYTKHISNLFSGLIFVCQYREKSIYPKCYSGLIIWCYSSFKERVYWHRAMGQHYRLRNTQAVLCRNTLVK